MSKKQVSELQKELLLKEEYIKKHSEIFNNYDKEIKTLKEKINNADKNCPDYEFLKVNIINQYENELKLSDNLKIAVELENEELKKSIANLANDWGKEVTKVEELKWEISELKSRNLWKRIINK